MAEIAVIGCGYVGLCTGVVFADLGNRVTGVDIDATKVARLQDGGCPIFEPGLEELLSRNVKAGRLTFTTKYDEAISHAQFVFICVNTSAGVHGGADMRFVRRAIQSVGHCLAPRRQTIIINKSTMPIGSGDMVHRAYAFSTKCGSLPSKRSGMSEQAPVPALPTPELRHNFVSMTGRGG